MQNGLFETDNRMAGYRLDRLEVYNWGTFHRKVYRLQPEGRGSLLTGENGSGKSTLADALLTLLVPSRKRNYNLSSGGEKRERTEKSYFLGAWGRAKDDGAFHERTKYLRSPEDYSVLVAVFKNAGDLREVSIAQVFWMAQEELRKMFVVAERGLAIQSDFAGFRDLADLKRRLRSDDRTEVYDQFNQYSAHFLRLVGLRSEKALDLFNQTVAIKEIESLNAFVRRHMLEEQDIGDALSRLIQNFQNLNLANDAIMKARHQMETLEPMVRDIDQHTELGSKISRLEAVRDAVPAFIEERRCEILKSRITDAKDELAIAEKRLVSVHAAVKEADQAIQDLRFSVQQSAAGQQLELLRVRTEALQSEMSDRKRSAERYNATSRRLGLEIDPEENAFHTRRKEVTAEQHRVRETLGKQMAARSELDFSLRKLSEEKSALEVELRALAARRSNIPARSLEIRTSLAEALNVPEDKLPFAGELIQVKDSQSEWEGAIERLLHNFGLRILVDDSIYSEVTRYVNGRHLNGKIVYSRVKASSRTRPTSSVAEQALVSKLEFREDSPFAFWLQEEISVHFDYVCCRDLSEFQRERRALTIEGLIKRDSALHEKDDRYDLRERSRYVLGWDNRRKIKSLEASLDRIERATSKAVKDLSALDRRAEEFREKDRLIGELLQWQEFDQIHWQRRAAAIEELEERRIELTKKNDDLRGLKERLHEKEVLKAGLEEEKSSLNRRHGDLSGAIGRSNEEIASAERTLGLFVGTPYRDYLPEVEGRVRRRRISLDYERLNEARQEIQSGIEAELVRERKIYTDLANGITSRMVYFKKEYAEESQDLEPRLEYKDAFRQLHNRIAGDDLPKYEERFRRLLNKSVTNELTGFKSFLEKGEEEIREKIDLLNRSLELIDYTPSTFVRLEINRSNDAEIRDFQARLRDCIPEAADTDIAAYEAAFYKIKALIDRIKEEERWKAKVTDVRNWLEFAVQERYREDGVQARYYSDSAGLSGGQKAKLAYTILASAIAYQYGLSGQELAGGSFRFVIIDEAFSRSDDANSRYAMELFERLNLQLMVVTPLDKINVVEPYIHVIHFVSNNEQQNDSRVSEITREEYILRKAEALGKGLAAEQAFSVLEPVQ